MKRREFITLLGGAAVSTPLLAHAQKTPTPVVGFLSLGSSAQFAPFAAEFISGLNEAGFQEGRNVAVEYRWAEGEYNQLPALATDLVRRQVSVIFAGGGTPPIRAVMAATSSIPIIFSLGGDPVKDGIVSSINRPDGNVTGVTFTSAPLGAKRLDLVRELVPKARVIALLVNPNSAAAVDEQRQLESLASTIRQKILVLSAKSAADIDAAFVSLVQEQADALLIPPDAFFLERSGQLVELAAHHVVPTIYPQREFVAAGGLMSYGVPLRASYHQAGVYAGRILAGAKPADLPIVQATKFELVLNLKTAKSLGLTFPQTLIATADVVIE
jgi:putative tryptophan/tyrosine transport system substrate-binding protein